MRWFRLERTQPKSEPSFQERGPLWRILTLLTIAVIALYASIFLASPKSVVLNIVLLPLLGASLVWQLQGRRIGVVLATTCVATIEAVLLSELLVSFHSKDVAESLARSLPGAVYLAVSAPVLVGSNRQRPYDDT
ncbi:MAG: hypothetical protein JST30_00565 [Armatimonadetes bacterium]|nr:hypothetical protein [Armatimonadota bacterium]